MGGFFVIMPAITVRDLKEREHREQKKTFEAFHNDIPAVIKSVDGNTRPPGQQGMTWVSILNQPESRVLVHNATTMDIAETPVWVGPEMKPPYRLEIKSLYFGGLSPESINSASGLQVGSHAQIHQYPSESDPGPDPVLIFQPALQPLKLTGNGSNLTVTVQPHVYVRNGRPVTFAGANVDLTTSVPGTASTQRKTLVYLDEVTNTVLTSDSSTVPTGGAQVPSYPDLPVDGRMCGYVTLSNGQTSIVTATHIEDFRDHQRSRIGTTGIISPELKNYTMTIGQDVSVSGNVTVDFDDGNVHILTLTGNTTVAFDNPPSANIYGELKIIIIQDSTGGRTITWPTNILWPSATEPTLTSTADRRDVFEFFTTDGGLFYYGRAEAQNYAPINNTIALNTLTLAGSAETNAVAATVGVTLAWLTLSSSVEDITAVQGDPVVTLDTITLSGSPETITVVNV
jgi:hypothetical protein